MPYKLASSLYPYLLMPHMCHIYNVLAASVLFRQAVSTGKTRVPPLGYAPG
jgi:hypothetical protein